MGVITRSDAAKLRLLRRGVVKAPKVLDLTNGDVWYAKLFLDEMAVWCNERVGAELGGLLTVLHCDDSSLFEPRERASELAAILRVEMTVAGYNQAPQD